VLGGLGLRLLWPARKGEAIRAGAHLFKPLLSEVEQGLPRVAHLPQPQDVVLKGASHYIQEDAPEEIVAAIKQWWPGK
jgi:pimeloyl-ACP methyl ester carboxylesterase